MNFVALALSLISAITIELKSPEGPIPNHDVQLIGFVEGQPQIIQKQRTNAKGLAIFQNPVKKSAPFAAHTDFENAPYMTDIFDGSTSQKILINVYRSENSSKDLMLEDVRLYYRLTSGGVRVDQDFVILNPSNRTRLGHHFSFDVPASAFDFQFGSGFSEQNTEIEGNQVKLNAPLYPGKTRLGISYRLEAKRGRVSAHQKMSLEIQSISLALDGSALKFDPPSNARLSRKIFEEREVRTFDWAGQRQRELQITVTGIPLDIRLHQWLPLLILGIALGLSLLNISRRSSSGPISDSSQVLAEFGRWNLLRQRGAVSDREYQLRRLESLEKLMTHDQD